MIDLFILEEYSQGNIDFNDFELLEDNIMSMAKELIEIKMNYMILENKYNDLKKDYDNMKREESWRLYPEGMGK